MKLCVCTIVHGEKYEQLGRTTHPQFLAYANRIGADFKVGRKPDFTHSPAWIKFILLDKLLAIYDRVIFFDTDLTLHPELPNLFDMVPETHLGAYFEGVYLDRSMAMLRALEFHKIKCEREYEGEYFNSGVMALSKIHRDLFIWPDEIEDNFYEQSLLNARVFAANIPVHKLHYHYNRMASHDTITGEDVFAAKIVHFAGMSQINYEATIAMIQDKWARNEKPFTRVHISCGGGIGDVVMSEPIVRHILEKVWPEAEFPDYRFTLSTSPYCKRVFDHIKHWNRLKIICTQKSLDPTVPYITLETHPHNDRILPYFAYPQIHNQLWSALNAARCYMTPEELRIRLAVHPEDEDELPKTINCLKSIAIHCGVGWPSKTFPVEYWQEIVNGLSNLGFQVVLFGKRIAELVDTETGEAVKVEKGTLEDVKCPVDGIDLRDKLSLGGLFALVNRCKATLTNDSLPTHIAGAFDNWFFLIASCKHPNLVMPFRMGSQEWRARYFLHRLTMSVENHKPNSMTPRSIKDVDGNIRDYLPEPRTVIDGIYFELNRSEIERKQMDESIVNFWGGGIGE